MKVSLGSSDMGVSAHLQSSKTGTTRFFTSNTHSSVVLQVMEYWCQYSYGLRVLDALMEYLCSTTCPVPVFPKKSQNMLVCCAGSACEQAWLVTSFPAS